MDELTVTLPAELVEKLRRRTPDKPPAQAVLDLVAQALAEEEEAEQPASGEEWWQRQRERFWRSSLGRYIHAQAEQARSRGTTPEQVRQEFLGRRSHCRPRGPALMEYFLFDTSALVKYYHSETGQPMGAQPGQTRAAPPSYLQSDSGGDALGSG